jgi:hypothetical protein
MAGNTEQSEPILSGSESDKGSESEKAVQIGTPPPPVRFRLGCLTTVALLTIAGAAVWLGSAGRRPNSDRMSANSDGVLSLDEEKPSRRKAASSTNTTDRALQNVTAIATTPTTMTTTTPLESAGVKALFSEAAAMGEAMKAALAAADALGGIAENEEAIARDLRKRKNMSQAVAEQVIATARMLEKEGKGNLSAAAILNQTVSVQKHTALHMDEQAEKSIQSAKSMLNSSGSVASVEDLAEKQLQVANATKDQAATLLDSANGMEDKSDRIIAQANKDIATANAIREEAGAENEVAKALGDKADSIASIVANVTEQVDAARARARSEGVQAANTSKTAKSTMAKYGDANSNIATAASAMKEAEKDINEAKGNIASAEALNDTARQERVAAKAVSKELGIQKKSFQEAMVKTEGMKAARSIVEMAKKDMKTLAVEDEKVAEELAGSKVLAEKAQVTKTQAEKHIAEANDVKNASSTAEQAANKVKDDIDSAEQVGIAGAGEVLAMQTVVDLNNEMVDAAESEVQALNSIVQEETAEAKSEVAAGANLSSMASDSSHEGAKLLHSTAEQVNQEVEESQKQMNKFSHMAERVDVDSVNRTAQAALQAARAREDQIGEQAMKSRTCVDMPGVRVQASADTEFNPILRMLSEPTGTHEECKDKCLRHPDCKQVIFSSATGCHLSEEASGSAADFTATYNSSFCGGKNEELALMDMLHKVYKQKPYIPPPQMCSWTDEDCSQTKCCNNFEAKWDYSKTYGQTCYKQDANFAGCRKSEPPTWWDGAALGGARVPRELPKAQDGWLTQGTSLFCFSVVMWHKAASKEFYSSEAELANNFKRNGLGIMQCDENAMFEGEDAAVTDWGSINNVDAFVHAWEHVRQDGSYRNHDWVVKVDVDAVFFPDRLKSHLGALRTPQHAKVYLWNTDYHFNFLGALEVLTTEALDAYFEHADLCSQKMDHDGGEDFYMKTCLDGIGVYHQNDPNLLFDRSAKKTSCADGWAAVFHPYKSVNDWNDCHSEAHTAR